MTPSTEDNLECRAWWATAPLPGAIGICHLKDDLDDAFVRLGITPLEIGSARVIDIAGIDEGVIARPGRDSALLMPHGGPRVRQLISRHLEDSGITFIDQAESDCRSRWPESETLVEACMLEALSITESPSAVDLLLAQPPRHRDSMLQARYSAQADPRRHLISPPLIVITGQPNVGKSTLLNRLAKTELAITADLEGTTRDAVAARLIIDGMACDVVDLPGLRESDDPIERRAISLSSRFLMEIDLLIALTDDVRNIPEGLGRTPDLIIRNKSDLGYGDATSDLSISAATGDGVERLALMIRSRIISDELMKDTSPWSFHHELDSARTQSPTIE
jgi:small GTP-binding protein